MSLSQQTSISDLREDGRYEASHFRRARDRDLYGFQLIGGAQRLHHAPRAVSLLKTQLNDSTGVERDQANVKTSFSDVDRAMPIRRVCSAATTGSCSVVCNVFIGSVCLTTDCAPSRAHTIRFK